MPILLVKVNINNVPDSPGRWLAGQISSVHPDNKNFGWEQMPVNYMGNATVEEINALSPVPFQAWTVTNSGTLTVGQDCEVGVGDTVAFQLTGYFVNYGVKTGHKGGFFQISVTNKTEEEVQYLLDRWTHNPTTKQVSNQGNRRLIEVTSDMVSATGKNAFTQVGVQELIDTLNADYPTANASFDSHTNNSFRFYVTVPIQGRDELIERINGAVRDMQYANRRWFVTPAGLTYLSNNGGTVSGTAEQIAGYLRDGLLD